MRTYNKYILNYLRGEINDIVDNNVGMSLYLFNLIIGNNVEGKL